MSIHEEEIEVAEPPEWAFSFWDMWAVLFHGIALVLVAIANGLECFAREFLVKAHLKREEAARREMAASCEALVNGEGERP